MSSDLLPLIVQIGVKTRQANTTVPTYRTEPQTSCSTFGDIHNSI